MENQEVQDSNSYSPALLEIDYVQGILNTTSRWAKFLAIIGFIFTGFIVLGSIGLLGGNSALSGIDQFPFNVIPMSVFGLLNLFAGAFYFVPSLYLFQYSEKLKTAMASRNENILVLALNKNKAFFKFVGIMTLVGLVLYFSLMALLIGTIASGGLDMVTP